MVDVSAVVRDRVDTWQPLAEESGVVIHVDTPSAGPAYAVVGAVDQIVDNLLDNALAVAPAGSTVEIAVRGHDGAVELSVADRGPGMTPEQIARSFDRFWRAGGGDVALTSPSGGGLVATVRFSRP